MYDICPVGKNELDKIGFLLFSLLLFCFVFLFQRSGITWDTGWGGALGLKLLSYKGCLTFVDEIFGCLLSFVGQLSESGSTRTNNSVLTLF